MLNRLICSEMLNRLICWLFSHKWVDCKGVDGWKYRYCPYCNTIRRKD